MAKEGRRKWLIFSFSESVQQLPLPIEEEKKAAFRKNRNAASDTEGGIDESFFTYLVILYVVASDAGFCCGRTGCVFDSPIPVGVGCAAL